MTKEEFKKIAGYDLENIEELRKLFQTQRMPLEGQWRLLDAYESGNFWDTLRVKLPKHQVIPDTNLIYHIKEGQINSVYSAPYIADVLPIDPEDADEARTINKLLEYKYNEKQLGYKQLVASNRTALFNCGFIQGAWNEDDDDIEYITRDPMSVLLDPNFIDYQEGRAVFINTEDSIDSIKAKYPDALDKSFTEMFYNPVSIVDTGKNYTGGLVKNSSRGMLPVWIAYKKVTDTENKQRLDQIIYTIDNIVLDYRKDIQPNYFPIVALYGLPPEKDGYGIGICYRVLKNVLSLNILDSIAVTHAYSSQRTPFVFDMNSGISLERLRRDINNPDVIFPVTNGAAKDALHRLEYPTLPVNLQNIRESLARSIEQISGIDERYLGRDTGSVTTTGGMERLQQRISMSDNIRISMIELYARNITKLTLDMYITQGKKIKVSLTNSREKDVQEMLEVDFSKYASKEKKFLYHINASPLLPKNRARLAEAANIIMQVQMQYGPQGGVKLMSPEEWLYFQDLPQKDMLLDRMKLERLHNDLEEISSELSSFAAMTEEGMRPESAVEQLANERQLRRQPAVQRKILENQS